MRNLATIRKIGSITPIEGKDRIVLARVDGWQVIVQKNEFQPGDLCIYVEIDSVLPEKPEFEFLRKRGFRIKTIKMGGVLSQGICFPLSILPSGDYKEGDDVTEVLGITQYAQTMDVEPQEPQKNTKKYPAFLMRFKWFRRLVLRPKKKNSSGFPFFVSKTDEVRIQNAPYLLENKTPFVFTEKVDGQSGTFTLERKVVGHIFKHTEFVYSVCSRNRRIPVPDNTSYWLVSHRYDIEDVLKRMIGTRDWIAIQGECIGPKIQGNKYGVAMCDLYVFNVITPDGRMGTLEAKDYAEAFGLKFVPIVNPSAILPDTVDEMLALADGTSELAPCLREGLVCRSMDGCISFKAVSNAFLLKWGE